VWLEELGPLINPMTSIGMEPVIFQLVTQCLNQLYYCVPLLGTVLDFITMLKNKYLLLQHWWRVESGSEEIPFEITQESSALQLSWTEHYSVHIYTEEMYMLVLPQSHISIKTLHFCEAQCLGSKT
jgi:hypothetical protein